MQGVEAPYSGGRRPTELIDAHPHPPTPQNKTPNGKVPGLLPQRRSTLSTSLIYTSGGVSHRKLVHGLVYALWVVCHPAPDVRVQRAVLVRKVQPHLPNQSAALSDALAG
jgi:hypothetical protein